MLWAIRLVMSLVLFDLSIVTVKQSFIVGQIVSSLVVLSLVLLDSINNLFVRCRSVAFVLS